MAEEGIPLPGACAPPHKGRGRGTLDTSTRQETMGGAGTERSEVESPGRGIPSSGHTTIRKKRLFKPRLQMLIAPGHTEMCEALGRANLVLPCLNQPDIHHPTQCGLHPIAPQLEWEGQPKMPCLPSRYASAPRLWPESREGDFQVGNISLVMGWQGSPATAQISKFSLFKERTRFEPEVSYTPFCRYSPFLVFICHFLI